MADLLLIYLLKMVMFHSYVKLSGGPGIRPEYKEDVCCCHLKVYLLFLSALGGLYTHLVLTLPGTCWFGSIAPTDLREIEIINQLSAGIIAIPDHFFHEGKRALSEGNLGCIGM